MATEKQIKALIDASHNLAAYFAADACRVIAEWPDDANIVPYLDDLPVKVVREFDRAIFAITEGDMDTADDEAEQRRKYEKALADMREAEIPQGRQDSPTSAGD